MILTAVVQIVLRWFVQMVLMVRTDGSMGVRGPLQARWYIRDLAEPELSQCRSFSLRVLTATLAHRWYSQRAVPQQYFADLAVRHCSQQYLQMVLTEVPKIVLTESSHRKFPQKVLTEVLTDSSHRWCSGDMVP